MGTREVDDLSRVNGVIKLHSDSVFTAQGRATVKSGGIKWEYSRECEYGFFLCLSFPMPTKKPSCSQVKAVLADQEPEELLKLVGDLYRLSKDNRVFIESRFLAGEDSLEHYEQVIADAMFAINHAATALVIKIKKPPGSDGVAVGFRPVDGALVGGV